MDINAEGYTLNESDGSATKAYVKMDLISDKKELNIKDIKIYVDNENVYISKNYLDAVMGASGQPLPDSIKNMPQEYIIMSTALDTSVMTEEEASASAQYQAMSEYIESMTSPEKRGEILEKASKIMDIVGFSVPVNKAGRTYTISLNSDQIIDMSVKSIDKTVVNIEEILKIMDLSPEFKVSKEEIAELRKQYNETGKDQIFQAMAVAKETIKGSEMTTKESFTDSTYKSDIGMKLIMRDMMDLNLSMTQTAKKVEKRELAMPDLKNAVSMDKYMEAFMPAEMPQTQQVAAVSSAK